MWLFKACTVVVHDLNATAHSLDVTAETLYEAVAQAPAIVRSHNSVGEIGKGLTTVTVKARNPGVYRQDSGFWKTGLTGAARARQTRY